MPVMLKAVPVALMLVTFSLAVPEFEIVTVCFAVVPTLTFVNETAVGLAASATVPVLPLGAAGGAAVKPAQPDSAMVVTMAVARARRPALALPFVKVGLI